MIQGQVCLTAKHGLPTVTLNSRMQESVANRAPQGQGQIYSSQSYQALL